MIYSNSKTCRLVCALCDGRMNAANFILSSSGKTLMTQLILDASALIILPKLTESVELLDESGKTIGHFHPAPRRVEPRVSEEELRRRMQQRGGRPLADIRADLEAKG
jgi:hypothetical protein